MNLSLALFLQIVFWTGWQKDALKFKALVLKMQDKMNWTTTASTTRLTIVQLQMAVATSRHRRRVLFRFFCSSCPFVSLQDWPETQTWHYTSWSDYKQDYGNWPTDQASDSNDWDSQDKGNWSSDHQPWTQYQQEDICSWSTDHDQHSYGNWTYETDQAHESMPADPHHDDGTSNKDVDGEHADGYHADEKVR